MRFYAKVESERASKGQGGNDYIRIYFTLEHADKVREPLGDLYLTKEGDDVLLTYCAEGGSVAEIDRLPIRRTCRACRGKNVEGCSYCDIEGSET